MATFTTVRIDAATGEPVEVQLTGQDFINDLNAPLITVYAYVGLTADLGWRVGRAACGLLTVARPWCIDDIAALRTWVPEGRPAGIVFGFDDQPDRLLTDGEAVILKIVRNAIIDAL